ncbi:MAG: hypothetical protein JWM43_25 [Acidobacteriaceae bacterium]|nr:hypothetical protein [Acidobacteriaceae bacterium]
MAAPVWVLSVDLQTKTATFQSGMAEAAKSARGAFGDIKSAATESGEGVSKSALNVRSAIGLVDNTIRGQHAAAMADLIKEFSHTGIVMAALPFAAAVGGIAAVAAIAVEVAEKIKEWREEQAKLQQEAMKFGTTINESFRSLDEKLLAAGIRSDELRNDHLAALRKELLLIDGQSMAELVKELDTVAKAADEVFAGLKGHWYTFGIGSDGATHALDTFKTKYDSLLAQGNDGAASDLLKGTRESAQHVLDMQKQAAGSRTGGGAYGPSVDYTKQYQALSELRKAGVGYTEKEVAAQTALVQVLSAQTSIEEKVAALKNKDKDNASGAVGKEAGARQADAAREAADHAQKMAEMTIAAERDAAQVSNVLHAATIDERLSQDLRLETETYNAQVEGNAQKLSALDKGSKDYSNQVKAANDRAEELSLEHENRMTQISGKAQEDHYRKDLQDLEQSEREKINGTQQASSERLSVVDAAIQEEKNRHLEETAFYRELLNMRVDLVRKAAEDEAKQSADAGKAEAENTQKMGELALAAWRGQAALADSARRTTAQQRMAEEVQFSNADFGIKATALAQEIAALDKTGKEYENKLRDLQNKQKQLVRAHENEVTDIRDKAAQEQNQKLSAALTRIEDMTSRSLTQVLMGHQSFASAMTGIGNQVVSGMMQTALKSMLTLDMSKEKEAASAARAMFLSGAKLPFPANIVAAPLMGAAAFASMMAFQTGGVVPGVGSGDVVPAMLTPGEGVVPNSMMDKLNKAVSSGEIGGGRHYHVHATFAPQVSAIDSTGVEEMLNTHSDKFNKHVEKNTTKDEPLKENYGTDND